jgi:hypothetical protein
MIEIDETIAGHLKRYEALFQEQNGGGTVIFECHTPQDDSEWTAFRLFLVRQPCVSCCSKTVMTNLYR